MLLLLLLACLCLLWASIAVNSNKMAEFNTFLTSVNAAVARRNGAQLPVTALVDQFYAEVQRMGGARWDTSSLIARLKSTKP